MLISILTLSSWLACIEPPPTATEGGTEPGGAAKPGAPEPGSDAANAAATEGKDPSPEASVVPTPHDGNDQSAPKAMYAQDAIPDGLTLNLDIVCDACTGQLLVRVEDASKNPPILATEKIFDKAGAGTIVVPKNINAILMVVDDSDKNGQPTPGEDIGLWTGGLLDTSKSHEQLSLEVGKVPDTPPLPPAKDDPRLQQEAGAEAAQKAD